MPLVADARIGSVKSFFYGISPLALQLMRAIVRLDSR